jgi:uncharacterized protein YidB (DUF937 family)
MALGAASGRLSMLMKILTSVLVYRSLTRGKGRIAALIGARMGSAGGLRGLLAGGAGGAFLAPILQHMLDSIQRGGAMTPERLEEALGDARLLWLMKQTGMTRNELLAGLTAAARDQARASRG